MNSRQKGLLTHIKQAAWRLRARTNNCTRFAPGPNCPSAPFSQLASVMNRTDSHSKPRGPFTRKSPPRTRVHHPEYESQGKHRDQSQSRLGLQGRRCRRISR